MNSLNFNLFFILILILIVFYLIFDGLIPYI